MFNVKKVVIQKSIDGSMNLIYPKTSADNVIYNESLSIKDKIDSMNSPVQSNTKEYWDSNNNLVSIKDAIYVYTDYKQLKNGDNIPGVKIGDGLAYLIDLPFIDVEITEHILNDQIHVSQQDRDKWNNKVRCFINEKDIENLCFSNNQKQHRVFQLKAY